MLKKIRVSAAIVVFSIITLLFLDFTGAIHAWFGWLAKIQLIPAILASNIIVVSILIISTLLFGRLYCSIICPLGIYQDIISRLAAKKKKNRFSYSPAKKLLRYSILGLFIIAFIAGLNTLIAFLDPYSLYGRIASNIFSPVYRIGNNLFALAAEHFESYLFYSTDVFIKSTITFIVAVLTFIIIGMLAWRNGRTYCNTICPVGTLLGFISKFSFLKPVIDVEKCNGCSLCARNCKASCIDHESGTIDYSRCVTCLNCIEKCRQGAISYRTSFLKKYRSDESDTAAVIHESKSTGSRRGFLSIATFFLFNGVVNAQQTVVEGGLALLKEKKSPKRSTDVTPPGSSGISNFYKHCTACGLCISACPNHILRPSGSIATLMQPVMTFDKGYCRPECTKCSEVCPTGAINLITKAEKAAIKIGSAVWQKDKCVVITDKVDCGNCARHCPTAAIQMIMLEPDKPDSKKIPAINSERCTGCGACENLCPSRPYSAIYVEGIEKHRII